MKVWHMFLSIYKGLSISEKPLKNGYRNICHTLIFVFIFLTLFWCYFQPFPCTQTIKVIGLIYFINELALTIRLCTSVSTVYLFSTAFFRRGGANPPPSLIYIQTPSCLWLMYRKICLLRTLSGQLKIQMCNFKMYLHLQKV